MGIIDDRVRHAFKEFYKDSDLYKFAQEMAHIGDYSVRSQHNWFVLVESIYNLKKEEEHKVIEELSFLNGTNLKGDPE